VEDPADILRRIAVYRRYLREGVDGDLAAEYLKTICSDEAELARIEARDRKA